MSFTREPTKELSALAQPFLPLVEAVRVHRVNNKPLALGSVALDRVHKGDSGAIVVDAHNGLVDVDARLSLPVLARRIAALGYFLPVLRPLPALPLWRAAAQLPFFVDAVVQSATLINVDGDVFQTPRGPRHSAGPSMLHATTTSPPFAFLVRARLKVTQKTHTGVVVKDCGDVDHAARFLRSLADDGRVFGAEGFGRHVAFWGGAVDGKGAPAAPFAGTAWTTPRARYTQTRSLACGDAPAMAAALADGKRVAVVPFMQRAAVLDDVAVVAAASDVKDVRAAAQALANALRASTKGSP